jgi:hypothetical protein
MPAARSCAALARWDIEMTAEPLPRRYVVELLHHAPAGVITVKISGDAHGYTVRTGRDDALRLARTIGGENPVIFEGLGGRMRAKKGTR